MTATYKAQSGEGWIAATEGIPLVKVGDIIHFARIPAAATEGMGLLCGHAPTFPFPPIKVSTEASVKPESPNLCPECLAQRRAAA